MAEPDYSAGEKADEFTEKLQLYFIGLTFTLLAFSVQSAKLGISKWADGLEILGWLLLLTSGLVGLWYLEWVTPIRKAQIQRAGWGKTLDNYKEHFTQGVRTVTRTEDQTEMELGPEIARIEGVVKKADAHIEELDEKMLRRYSAAKWTFVLGVLALILSRALPAIYRMFHYTLL